jgi:diguanylate cyclase (GGDEF)-like protein
MLLRFAQNGGELHLTPPEKRSGRAFARARLPELTGELVPLLHSTLDVEELMRLFGRELARGLGQSSLSYASTGRGIDVGSGRPARHELAAALVVDNQELGAITVTRSRAFGPQDEAAFQRYLSNLVMPLRNALLYHDAVQASLKDALTGLHNRKFLETTLRREVGLSHRHGTPLSLIVLDIDRFKAINDERGHHAGDAALQQVARSLAGGMRETDVLARFGGDEFTILLSNTRLSGAVVAARHIIERLRSAPLPAGAASVRVSVSLGIAALRKRDGHQRLFERADAALYAAKHAGGGRIGVASGARARILS